MVLDAATAKALFAIIMISTQRADEIKPQLPLQAVDHGDSWLVKGTPFTSTRPHARFCMTHMFFKKESAEVIGILSQARMIPTAAESAHWHEVMTPDQYAGVFGPPSRFEPNGVLDIYFALYGGLINTPEDAIDYAFVLMQTRSDLAPIQKSDLRAKEQDRVWHITSKTSNHAEDREILSFSRSDGKLLTGDL